MVLVRPFDAGDLFLYIVDKPLIIIVNMRWLVVLFPLLCFAVICTLTVFGLVIATFETWGDCRVGARYTMWSRCSDMSWWVNSETSQKNSVPDC